MKYSQFIKLRPDEKILAMAREHPITHVGRWCIALVWILLPFFFLFPLIDRGPAGVTGFGFLLVTGLLFGVASYKRWSETVLLVTDKRVIDVEQKGLFARRMTDTPLARIDEVTREKRGLGAVLFGYGTLCIVTSGEAADIVFHRLPHMDDLADLIESMRNDQDAKGA